MSVKVAENLSNAPAKTEPTTKKSDTLMPTSTQKKPENLSASEKRPKPKEEPKASPKE